MNERSTPRSAGQKQLALKLMNSLALAVASLLFGYLLAALIFAG